jgi:Restriction endonuclease fold toxin 3
VSNPIVAALEQMAQRVGKTLSQDAGKAIEDMYRQAGKRTEDVVKRITETDQEHARQLVEIAEHLGQRAPSAAATDVERAAQSAERAGLRQQFSDLLEPGGAIREDPAALNGGLGRLLKVPKPDPSADALAAKLGGQSCMKFDNDPHEFDAVTDDYLAQTKPADFTLNKRFRDQTKATFELAGQSGRTPYFHFESPPGPGVLKKIDEYAQRYGTTPVVDISPL